jgi:TonB-dependent receptor
LSPSKIAIVFILAVAMAFPQTDTGVSGFVLDAHTGRPIAGASVAVTGRAETAATDADGRFAIKVPPGSYALAIAAGNYGNVNVSDVTVTAGEMAEASAVMTNKSMVTRVDVVETVSAVQATAEAMLTERKLSAVVSDSIGRQELAAGTSSDAAGALEKVTGVSVVGEGYVYVRGLGERYSSTQLNGALIPTTEPEKRVVPLDLFPTGMIENIKIAKTYSPDLPAEFSGGLVQLQTVEFPPKRMFSISMKSGFNTVSTFKRFLDHASNGAADFWGFGAGSRALPGIIPPDSRIIQGRYTSQELQTVGRSFAPIWEPRSTPSMRPAVDWSANGGGVIGKLGLVGAVSFSNRPQVRSELQRYLRMAGTTPIVTSEYKDFREYTESARIGAALNASYRLSANHKLISRNTWTHDTDDSSRQFSGYDGVTDAEIKAERLRYIQRGVFASGLSGEHVFTALRNSLVQWQFTYSNSSRNEPDLREVLRNVYPDGTAPFTSGSGSGIRFFSDLHDKIYEPQLNYSIPFFKGSLAGQFKTGFQATVRTRDFQARRFRFNPQNASTINFFLPSDKLFAPENIRPTGFQIIEYTRGTDAYDASMNVYAGYAMLDLNLGPKLRVSGGIRFEAAEQEVITVDNQIPNAAPVIARLQNTDPIPALNVVYALSPRQNIRLSFSRTLSRPDFRELSPFDFTNVQGGFVTVGNANLRRASIDNLDARWELYPGGNQLVAASVFFKRFTDPIEQTVIVSNDLRQSYINAKGARNFGFELEFRQGLRRFTAALAEFSLTSNFTFVDSNIEIRPEDALVLTTPSRPLLGQSRYVFNGGIQWARAKWHSDAQLFATHVSRRISDVGSYGLPDIYQEGTTNLDAVYQYRIGERGKWVLRLEAENLTNNDFRWTQSTILQRQYRLGRTFQVGVTYSFF